MKAVSSRRMKAIEAAAIRRFKIPALILMENAGISATRAIEKMLRNKKTPVVVVCGWGNNGGDGFVVARQLHNRGCTLKIFLIGKKKQMSPEAQINFDIIRAMRLSVVRIVSERQISTFAARIKNAGIIVDALFGIGIRGGLAPFYCRIIECINKSPARVVSLDVPSGMDADTGSVVSAAVRTHTTITMGRVKKGFLRPAAKRFIGRVVVADISLPVQLQK